MSIYKTTLRLDLNNEMHCRLYEWIKNRDKNKYHSIAEYFIAAVASLEAEEKNVLSERERKEICIGVVEELYKQGFLNHRIGL